MDLQGFIQSLLVANSLKLSLKQKLCTKDSKFYESWEVQSLPESLFKGFKRTTLLIWQAGKNLL